MSKMVIIRHFHKLKKLVIMAFQYSCSFLHYLDVKMLVNMKLDVIWHKELLFRISDFSGLFNFEWHSENKVGNVGILVLRRDLEKLYLNGSAASLLTISH